ncbi:TPA: hypothetical protein ACIVB1_001859 [Salmonella enterica subsp. diarizonae serovar 61:l,v:z35]|nr:hypothetical protein [Salmonella enterica subsp. enterica serovar Newport]
MKSKQSLLSLLVALAMAPVMVAEASDDSNTPLNFNYNRPSSLSLDPRLSLQTRGCLSLVDPMKVNIRFQNGIDVSGLKVNVKVKGAPASRNYVLYTPAAATLSRQRSNDNTGIDDSFLVPWSVVTNGKAQLTGQYTVQTPYKKWYTYERPFCFKAGHTLSGAQAQPTDAFNTGGLIPIYQTGHPPYVYSNGRGKDLGNRGDCSFINGYEEIHTGPTYDTPSTPEDNTPYTGYWPDYNVLPSYIRDSVLNRVFYRDKLLHEVFPNSYNDNDDINNTVDPVKQNTSEVSWDLPLAGGNREYNKMTLKEGGFDLTLANRNISELTLTVTNDKTGKSSVFTWKRDDSGNKLLNNTLSLMNKSDASTGLLKPGVIQDGSDAYKASNFYTDGVKQDYFRGTLVDQELLSPVYTNFVKGTPLSLPAVSQGSINVVSTDSLTIRLGQNNGEYNASIYGQPLKFAPVKTADGTVLSTAQQVRDACY